LAVLRGTSAPGKKPKKRKQANFHGNVYALGLGVYENWTLCYVMMQLMQREQGVQLLDCLYSEKSMWGKTKDGLGAPTYFYPPESWFVQTFWTETYGPARSGILTMRYLSTSKKGMNKDPGVRRTGPPCALRHLARSHSHSKMWRRADVSPWTWPPGFSGSAHPQVRQAKSLSG